MHFPVWQLGRKIIDCCDKSVFFFLSFFVVIHGRVLCFLGVAVLACPVWSCGPFTGLKAIKTRCVRARK